MEFKYQVYFNDYVNIEYYLKLKYANDEWQSASSLRCDVSTTAAMPVINDERVCVRWCVLVNFQKTW